MAVSCIGPCYRTIFVSEIFRVMSIFHTYGREVSSIPLPSTFTFPFLYTPHPLCVEAVAELKAMLSRHTEWKAELSRGKMLGVLVVLSPEGVLGYLAAYSGLLDNSNQCDGFVPAVFDFLQADGYFKQEENHISRINKMIDLLQRSAAYKEVQRQTREAEQEAECQLEVARRQMKEEKKRRDGLRQRPISPDEEQQLIRQSQFQKAELKRLKQNLDARLQGLRQNEKTFDDRLQALKQEREQRSEALQQWLFSHFVMLNAKGERRNLCELFADTSQRVPPAGAGECCAPKLLQYAYQNGYQPLCMAEFWCGASPKAELRRDGYFYPACKGKCEPILRFMLQGLQVDVHPHLSAAAGVAADLEVVYEDEWLLVVNKPAGLLSVPGKLDVDSVADRVKRMRPGLQGPAIVHRLDMDTSGLLLIAKTKFVHQQLQSLFKNRLVKKQYVALLDGEVNMPPDNCLINYEVGGRGLRLGVIRLPLCPNLDDRPRQMVSYESGKSALTYYEVVSVGGGQSRVNFYPQTGRTHQLRVHAASPDGMDAPIVGDTLYGRKAQRLYLHAESLSLVHPVTHEVLSLTCKPDF